VRLVALVPRRADGGRRDELWRYVEQRWHDEHPEITIFEGHHDHGSFNRSAALNEAAAAAGDWDLAVIMDADSFVGPRQLQRGVMEAVSSGQVVFPHEQFSYLSRKMSDRIMAGYRGDWSAGIEWELASTCSSCVIVRRDLWDEVGGFDEGFIGWGMEDVAFSLACQALRAGCQRLPGRVWHLHHQPTTGAHHEFTANVERMRRYEACDYRAGPMRELLNELHAVRV
jgi:GT2 family glycosyltransferase